MVLHHPAVLLSPAAVGCRVEGRALPVEVLSSDARLEMIHLKWSKVGFLNLSAWACPASTQAPEHLEASQ